MSYKKLLIIKFILVIIVLHCSWRNYSLILLPSFCHPSAVHQFSNSFRYICNAIDYELKRQQKLLDQGEKLTQETRGWNQEKKETFSQRIKEEAADYRYFPEPDIPPISISNDLVEDIKKNLPQLPQEKIDQLTKLGIEKRFADHIADNPAHVNLVVALADQKDIDINKLANYIVNGKINPDQSTDQVKNYI